MLNVINKNKALPIVSRYYKKAAITGYIPHASVSRMIAYLFLIDFVETLYPYFEDDKTYWVIDRALVKIFTDGGCLFPYEAVHANYLQLVNAVGKAHYMGSSVLRITMDNVMRETEDSYLRRII